MDNSNSNGSSSSSSSSSSNPNQAKPLNLLSKTLPLTAATPPQLRARRQFSFNGMHFETNGLHRIKGGGGAAAGLTVRPDANQSSGVLHYQNQHQQNYHTYNHPHHHQQQQQQQQQPQPQPQLPRSEDNGDGEKMLHTSRISLGDRASQMSTFRKRMQRMPWHKTDAIGDRAGGGERPSNFVPGRRFAPSPSETFPICERDDGNRQDNSKLDNYYNTNENEQEEEAATAANSRIISHGGSSYRRGAIGDGNSAPRFVLNQSMLARGAGGLGTTLHYSKMDYITLIGFLLGCIMSNILFFLCWYFSWLKCQVIKLRKHFLGHANLWDFFDFEDTTRYSMQTKLILAPIIVACSLLYCVVNVLHLMFKLVRADVPRTVVDVVQRVANSGLLSNGGRYRWS